MPTIAETLMQQGFEQAKAPGPITSAMSGFQQGAELAMNAEKIQQQREAIKVQKQQVEDAKIDKFITAVEKGQQFSGKAQSNYYNKFLPQYRNLLNLQDKFSDDALSFMTSGPETLGRFNTILSMRRNGEINGNQMMSMLNDPIEMAGVQMTPDMYKLVGEADKVAVENSVEVNKQRTAIESVGYEKEQSNIANRWDAYQSGGGLAGFEKTVNSLEDAIAMLSPGPNGEPPKVELGTFAKNLPWGSTDDVLARTDPDAKALNDIIKGGINIKATSGDPNPAERQINEIMSRAIDARLNNKQNIAKLKTELAKTKSSHSDMVGEFRKFGKPAKDYQDKKIKQENFDPASMKAKINAIKDKAARERAITAAANRLGITVQDFKQKAGVK